MTSDMKFFIFFLFLLILAIAAFLLIYEGHEYECRLPNGGHFQIHWNEKSRKIDMLYWQPKGKQKKPPKNIVHIEGEKPKPKPDPYEFLR